MRENQTKKQFKMDAIPSKHIPYACHLDQNTILTKRGELVQIIKIDGFSVEQVGGIDANIRQSIRDSLKKNIDDHSYSIWFHTVRKKKNIDKSSPFENSLPSTIHNSWCVKNYWREKYINEIYISIIIKPNAKNLSAMDEILSALWFPGLKKNNLTSLYSNKKKLTETVSKINTDLKKHGSQILTIKYEDDHARSELIDLFYMLMHFHSKRTEIPICDISEYLATGNFAFGRNSYEIVDHGHKKNFAATLTIKEYNKDNDQLVEKLLRLPTEHIITQAIIPCPKTEALKTVSELEYLMKVSGNDELEKMFKLNEITNITDADDLTAYCEYQSSINIIADSVTNLEVYVERFVTEAKKLGLAIVREDLLMPSLYWANLPASFNYFERKLHMPTSWAGGYCSIASAPLGYLQSKWGEAITIFRSHDGTPYFFNFHNQKGGGHTFINGPQDSGKTVLAHFLLSEASRLLSRLIIIGDKKSSILIKSLKGHFFVLTQNVQFFNPLLLPLEREENVNFLIDFLQQILDNPPKEIITSIVEKLKSTSLSERNLNLLSTLTDDTKIIESLKKWQSGGEYDGLFNANQDLFLLTAEKHIWGFDVSFFKSNQIVLNFIGCYIKHIFKILAQDNARSLMMVNDLPQLFGDGSFALNLVEELKYISEKNGIMVCAIASEDLPACKISDALVSSFDNKISFPNLVNSDVVSKIFNFTPQQISLLKEMKIIYRNFSVFKTGEQDIICELNLDGIDYAIKLLGGFPEVVAKMEEILVNGEENWEEKLFTAINNKK